MKIASCLPTGRTLNRTHFHNAEILHKLVESRDGRGLVTVCNHASRLDDPLMFCKLYSKPVLVISSYKCTS